VQLSTPTNANRSLLCQNKSDVRDVILHVQTRNSTTAPPPTSSHAPGDARRVSRGGGGGGRGATARRTSEVLPLRVAATKPLGIRQNKRNFRPNGLYFTDFPQDSLLFHLNMPFLRVRHLSPFKPFARPLNIIRS